MKGSFGFTGKLLYGWLLLSVLCLGFAGLFAFMIAMARTPGIGPHMPMGPDYFHVGLVGHVTLAFVLWFLSFESFLWLYSTTHYAGREVSGRWLPVMALLFSSGGVALVVVSAFAGLGGAVLANYVPVLRTPVFYTALVLFSLGLLINIIGALSAALRIRKERKGLPPLTLAMTVAGVSALVAFLCFALSGYYEYRAGTVDFERLFWGGGHVLQFVHTITAAGVWLYLARIYTGQDAVGHRAQTLLYLFYLPFVLAGPLVYFYYDIWEQAYREAFSFQMRWGLGPSTVVFIVLVALLLVRRRGLFSGGPGLSALVLSMALFVLGGFISLGIRGINTIIPAHYHSEIAGITIAFMGLFYELVPYIRSPLYSKRVASVQPFLYFAGVVLFVAGFYVAGAHGAMRKTYGAAQGPGGIGRMAGLALMGFGGLVSILGGAAFVINALATLFGGHGPLDVEENLRA